MIEQKFLDYISLCKAIDYHFYEELFDYYVKSLNLKTVNKLTFDTSDKTYYQPSKKTININLNELYEYALFNNYSVVCRYKQILYINSELLAYLFHELIHAKQQNIIKKNEIANELIVDALKKSFRRAYFYNKLYEEFHDYFVIEYNANVESQLMLKEFLDKLDLEYNPYRLQLYLENGYNNICPQERESNLLNKKYKIKNLNQVSEFEKIIYGFPIEKEKIIIKK